MSNISNIERIYLRMPDVTAACRVGADVAFLISGSGIVGESNFQLLLDFTRQLVYGLNVNRKDSQVQLLLPSVFSLVISTVNATLPAFAAERRAAAPWLLAAGARPCALPAERSAANPPHATVPVKRWDRQTDGRPTVT